MPLLTAKDTEETNLKVKKDYSTKQLNDRHMKLKALLRKGFTLQSKLFRLPKNHALILM